MQSILFKHVKLNTVGLLLLSLGFIMERVKYSIGKERRILNTRQGVLVDWPVVQSCDNIEHQAQNKISF